MELGRIQDEAALIAIAVQICELKPKTATEAARLIRRWRVGTKPGSAAQLGQELAEHIDQYRDRHPDTTADMILDALARV